MYMLYNTFLYCTSHLFHVPTPEQTSDKATQATSHCQNRSCQRTTAGMFRDVSWAGTFEATAGYNRSPVNDRERLHGSRPGDESLSTTRPNSSAKRINPFSGLVRIPSKRDFWSTFDGTSRSALGAPGRYNKTPTPPQPPPGFSKRPANSSSNFRFASTPLRFKLPTASAVFGSSNAAVPGVAHAAHASPGLTDTELQSPSKFSQIRNDIRSIGLGICDALDPHRDFSKTKPASGM